MKWGIPVLPVDPANYNIKPLTWQEISIVGEATIIIRVSQCQEYSLKFLVAQNMLKILMNMPFLKILLTAPCIKIL